MFGRSFINYSARFAAWVTPHVKEWHRQRNEQQQEGERHLSAGNFTEAERHLTAAVAQAVERRASKSKLVTLRLQLAEAQRALGKWDAAETTARAAIEDAGRDAEWRALALDQLADVQIAQGNFSAAENTICEAALLPADPAAEARRMYLLARARSHGGENAQGFPTYEKAVALHERALGADHVETGNLLSELGALERARGVHADAQRHLRQALKIHEKRCGADSTEVAEDLSMLAASLEESGDVEGAMAQYERALRMKERHVGGNMTELAGMQARVARMYLQWGQKGKARELLVQAIPALERTPGKPLASALETMAEIEEQAGRQGEATRLRELAITVVLPRG
jgi:tetratricopeptide (TPR) repeat protein